MRGLWDRVMGPGTTRAENLGTMLAALLAATAVGIDTHVRLGVGGLAWVVATAIAFDIGAGVWVLATPAARRWYHREGMGWLQALAFPAGHVHPFVVAALFAGAPWRWAGFLYGAIVLATAAVRVAPRPLRNSTALLASAVIIAVAAALGPDAPAWLAPTLTLKLVAAHAVPDIPALAAAPQE